MDKESYIQLHRQMIDLWILKLTNLPQAHWAPYERTELLNFLKGLVDDKDDLC